MMAEMGTATIDQAALRQMTIGI